MTEAPAFQLFAADFYMDTLEWSVDEVGIYWRLLEAQWVNGSIPDDMERLCRIAGCGAKKFSSGWKIVGAKFKLNGDGRLQNVRLEETREVQRKYRESQSEAGKRGAEKRWKGDNNPIGNPIGKANSETIALQSSSLKEEEKDIQAALVFPLRNGEDFSLGLSKISEYEKTYRNIDVPFELKKCLQWNIDNEGKRKTARGILSHLNKWLGKASELAGPIPLAGIQHDNTAADEARKDMQARDPEKARENLRRISEMAQKIGKT